MKLNGIMRVRIVLSGLIFSLCALIWAVTIVQSYSAEQRARTELSNARELAAKEAKPNIFDQFDDKAEGPWNAYKRQPIAIDSYEREWNHAQRDLRNVLTIGVAWALLPTIIFWLLGSIVGWVYRGFKEPKEN